MDVAIAAMSDGIGEVAGERFIDADLHFHLALADATDNRLIVHSMHAVRDTLRRALITVYAIPGSPQSAIGEHRAIRAAVAARQATRARKAMALHLARVEGDVESGSGDG
jgi:GntR family transcriptional repressor for pyruvate dehydrogenase complex